MFDEKMQTQRLEFRPPSVVDAPSIFEQWTSEPDVTRFLLWPTHRDVEDTRAFLRGCQQAWRERASRFPWVLTRTDDSTPVGMIELNLDGLAVSVGYVISPRFQGTGFATEVLVHVIEVALAKPFGAYLVGRKIVVGLKQEVCRQGMEHREDEMSVGTKKTTELAGGSTRRMRAALRCLRKRPMLGDALLRVFSRPIWTRLTNTRTTGRTSSPSMRTTFSCRYERPTSRIGAKRAARSPNPP